MDHRNISDATKQANNSSTQEEIDRLLENLPAKLDLAINLPSRNDFYELEDPSHPITVRPMVYEDERLLIDANRKGADGINLLLERCLSNVDYKRLLIVDKLIVLVKLREATYGSRYNFTMACPECDVKEDVELDINDLVMRPLPEDLTEPYSITLPTIDKEVKIRFPRVEDEHYFHGTKAYKNLWRFVDSIGGNTNKKVISEVIKQLPLTDLHTLMENIGMTKWGLEPKVSFSCDDCGEESEVLIPISSDFFYKSS
jgi:hypothetical protein